MKTSRCRNCGKVFKNKNQKILHKKKYPDGCNNIEKEVDDKMGIFTKDKKGIPATPPVEPIDNDLIEDEEDEEDESVEEEEEEVEVPEIIPKRKTPVKKSVEEPVEEQEEELTEDKVKQILINFETRLQKIEYNLRLIP